MLGSTGYMSRNIIIYFGIIQFAKENAMCQRANGIKKLIQTSGYTPIIIGVDASVERGKYIEIGDNTFAIHEPTSFKEWIEYSLSAEDIINVINRIGKERIKSFVMADYRFIPMNEVKKYCEKNKINYCIDVMDWFQAGDTLNSKIKRIDNNLRMKKFYPKVQRRIYICSSYYKTLGKTSHTSVIPGIVSLSEKQKGSISQFKDEYKKESNKIVLSFAGNPGIKCEKEKINWVIRALARNELKNKFIFYIAGVDKNTFLSNNPELSSYISNDIKFLGRISHQKCLNLIAISDFSLVIRPSNQLSNYGFSTKIAESFECGTPVLSTNTSDNKKYIMNGLNGFVCDANYASLVKCLENVASYNRDYLDKLRQNCKMNNTLRYKKFVDQFRNVVE